MKRAALFFTLCLTVTYGVCANVPALNLGNTGVFVANPSADVTMCPQIRTVVGG